MEAKRYEVEDGRRRDEGPDPARTAALGSAREELLAEPSADLTPAERRLLEDLEVAVHGADGMYQEGAARHYLSVGISALRAVEVALERSGRSAPIRSILDLGSGFGRALRFFAARFPGAELTAVEVLPAALTFCEQTFGARTIFSSSDLAELELPGRYDLAWCGSVVTHLDAEPSSELLAVVAGVLRPEGVGIFTTHGARSVELIDRGMTYGLDEAGLSRLLAGYRASGYGYADYPGQDGYGISLVDRHRMERLAAASGHWLPICFLARAWDDHQDVYAFARA